MPSLVQQSKSQTNSSSTTATFGATPTSGNLLIAEALTNGNQSGLGISGWSEVKTNFSGTAQSVGIFWKISNGTETTVTSTGNTICRLHIQEWSGMANPADTDGSNSNTQNTTQTISAGSVSTTFADVLLITAGGISTGGSGTGSWDNSFSVLDADGTSPRLFSGYRIVSSTGTYSTTGTLHGSNTNMGAVIVAFKGASTPPPSFTPTPMMHMMAQSGGLM